MREEAAVAVMSEQYLDLSALLDAFSRASDLVGVEGGVSLPATAVWSLES